MLLVAVLTVRRARLDDFRRFEGQAAQIMARYGGRIERAVVLDEPPPPEPDAIRELHIVRFPDAAAFAAYRADPDLAALAAIRDAGVIRTELWTATDGPAY
jgi:uncharacterized protein (DUF1330 family)